MNLEQVGSAILRGETLHEPLNTMELANSLIYHRLHILALDGDWQATWRRELESHLLHPARIEAAREFARERLMTRVIRSFGDAGVAALTLKGQALATRYYSNSGQRPRSDIDLLVRSEDFERAGWALENIGLKPDIQLPGRLVGHAIAYRDGSGNTIDLHFRLSKRALVEKILPPEVIFSRAQWNGVLGIPDHVDLAIHAALHLWGHHRDQFIPRVLWYDLILLTQAFGPNDWVELARRSGVREVRQHVAHAIERAILWYEGHELATQPNQNAWSAWLDDLRILPWSEKVTLTRELLFPPSEYMGERAYLSRIISGLAKLKT